MAASLFVCTSMIISTNQSTDPQHLEDRVFLPYLDPTSFVQATPETCALLPATWLGVVVEVKGSFYCAKR